ncbi:EcsC family protein [Falsiroseomonas selenitidurans]|uniref:EcsC family protein n=1 Tax=Falsiroseomonas selenitidurans TaxID=2716335 RepID=A0ABX1E592_9PROT|nr:EcsC family protein [Falsiroseomonas selenitidurans]NKC32341.1 EcsC family protein [Falsiroseomonas selenitidurans]
MSLTIAPPPPDILPEAARAELARAVAQLEDVSLAARFSAAIGTPIEALKNRLPGPAQAMLDGAVKRALSSAMQAALRAQPSANPTPLPAAWFHRGLAAAAGAAGGAFGLPGTLMELPVSTTLLLRQIAAVAEANGEALGDPLIAAECLKVFAIGGRDTRDDAAESGYFAVRLALAEALKGVTTKGLVGGLLPGFLGTIAGRFGGPVALKLSAQAAPVIGAAAGAAVNIAFLEHFRGVAEGHFTVRRLERRHGAVAVRAAYEDLARLRDARFTG